MAIIHFIGGIHGVGKGTICNKICEQTNLTHLTASELLKWNEISSIDNKKVKDIKDTQERLLIGLNNATQKDSSYLLDGHFCLFNTNNIVEKIPVETFVKISPKSITVVTTEVKLIKKRLENRDGRIYNSNILEYMQNQEKEYAKEVALKLDIPYIKIKNEDCNKFIHLIYGLK